MWYWIFGIPNHYGTQSKSRWMRKVHRSQHDHRADLQQNRFIVPIASRSRNATGAPTMLGQPPVRNFEAQQIRLRSSTITAQLAPRSIAPREVPGNCSRKLTFEHKHIDYVTSAVIREEVSIARSITDTAGIRGANAANNRYKLRIYAGTSDTLLRRSNSGWYVNSQRHSHS